MSVLDSTAFSHENIVSGVTAAMTGTSDTDIIAAPGAGVRLYITQITVVNSHATVGTEIDIKNGSTSIYKGYVKAIDTPLVLNFPTPLRLSANSALKVANVTTGSNTFASAAGFKASV